MFFEIFVIDLRSLLGRRTVSISSEVLESRLVLVFIGKE